VTERVTRRNYLWDERRVSEKIGYQRMISIWKRLGGMGRTRLLFLDTARVAQANCLSA